MLPQRDFQICKYCLGRILEVASLAASPCILMLAQLTTGNKEQTGPTRAPVRWQGLLRNEDAVDNISEEA